MTVTLAVAAEGHTPALLLRPWQAADMPGLLAAMEHDYPSQGLRPHPDVDAGPVRWTGPRDDHEAGIWLSGQDRGCRVGDWLTLAVLDQQGRVLGQVGRDAWLLTVPTEHSRAAAVSAACGPDGSGTAPTRRSVTRRLRNRLLFSLITIRRT
jgi:hypothetical protein